jgi:hypothetical protein
MTETISITINRGDNQMATSFLVWSAFRRYPTTDGDGVFVGEIEISPSATSVSQDWDSPNNSADWKFICAPKFNEIVGIFGQLESA